MRKILSQEEKSKKAKRNQLIIGGILVLIMILSTLGYSFRSSDEEKIANTDAVSYKDFQFIKTNGIWKIDLYGKEIYFSNFPNETDIQANVNLLNKYQNLPLYLYSNNSAIDLEIYRTIGQFVQRMQKACPENKTCEQDLPMKNCENNFIVVEESNATEIIQNNKCVFVKAKKEDLLRITDELLFKIFSIK